MGHHPGERQPADPPAQHHERQERAQGPSGADEQAFTVSVYARPKIISMPDLRVDKFQFYTYDDDGKVPPIDPAQQS